MLQAAMDAALAVPVFRGLRRSQIREKPPAVSSDDTRTGQRESAVDHATQPYAVTAVKAADVADTPAVEVRSRTI